MRLFQVYLYFFMLFFLAIPVLALPTVSMNTTSVSYISSYTEPELYYKVHDSPKLSVPCMNNGEYCSASATCNLTVQYPNGNAMIVNQQMTNNVSFHYYNLTGITQVGDYQSTVACIDGTVKGYDVFSFQVNNSGRKIENLLSIIILFCFLIFISIGLITASTYYKNVMLYPSILFLSVLLTILMWILYMSTIAINRVFYVIFWITLLASSVLLLIILWEIVIGYMTFISKKGREKRDMGDQF